MSTTDLDHEPLLAQQLLLLSLAGEVTGEPTPWISLQCVVMGALVAELVDREHVVVRFSTVLGDNTIDVLDAQSTGDDVLDQALLVLSGGRVAAVDRDVSLGLRMWGSLARRRLRATGKVRKRDLMRWWEGCWSCGEFPELSPTLLCQLLRLYEELGLIHEPLHERMGVDPNAPGFGVGPLPGRQVRERFRQFTLGGLEPPDARMHYVVALCGSWEPTWLRESLCSKGEERGATRRRAGPFFQRDPLARAVSLVVDRWEAQFDAG